MAVEDVPSGDADELARRQVNADEGVVPQRASFAVELGRFLLLALAYLSLLPALAWYLAYLELGDNRWWMFLLNSGATYLFAPAPIVLIAGVIARRWALVAAALVPLIVATMLFGQLLVPRSLKVANVAPEAPRLTVMTFNLHANNHDSAAIATAIRASDADVVALQELGPVVAERLRSELAGEYPFLEVATTPGNPGQGVLSRYPIETLSRDFGWHGGRNPQGVLLTLPWGEAILLNAHNLSTSRSLGEWPSEIADSMRQREYVSELISEFAAGSSLPVIALGDFNTTERSTAYRLLTQELSDAWLEAGFGFGHTFPGGPLAPTPFGLTPPRWLLRIDYVFHSRELTALDARIGPWDGGSDHRPVVAVLAWGP